ncbi:MAG: hypothetical protein K9K78_00815 [Spirochaetales bacterium]|nr:hypothetical protein [Spirochaetales bacterium]
MGIDSLAGMFMSESMLMSERLQVRHARNGELLYCPVQSRNQPGKG